MNEKKVLSLLGLAKRAGKTASGEFSVEKAVKDRSARLVIIAADASGNTKKLFGDKCRTYHVPCYECGTQESLGHALGLEYRASAAVLDQGFAAAVEKLLKTGMADSTGRQGESTEAENGKNQNI